MFCAWSFIFISICSSGLIVLNHGIDLNFMKDFKSLGIWQRSHKLTLDIYKLSTAFPAEEKFGLISQIRRSCSSIPTNIAEGCGRNSDADMKRFFTIAMGSASELDCQLLLAKDLSFISNPDYELVFQELTAIKKMLNSFIKKLNSTI